MSELKMVKRTIRLYESDLLLAKRFYPNIGYNHILRLLLHRHLVRLENAIREREVSINGASADQTISQEILILNGDSDGTQA